MKAHVIENNIVTNTIMVDSLDFLPNLVEATEGGIGWSYVDGVFTAPADTRTYEEMASIVRRKRNNKLTASDWTQGKDIPNTLSAIWAVYRNDLRNVPQQAGFPWNVTWPSQPE